MPISVFFSLVTALNFQVQAKKNWNYLASGVKALQNYIYNENTIIILIDEIMLLYGI